MLHCHGAHKVAAAGGTSLCLEASLCRIWKQRSALERALNSLTRTSTMNFAANGHTLLITLRQHVTVITPINMSGIQPHLITRPTPPLTHLGSPTVSDDLEVLKVLQRVPGCQKALCASRKRAERCTYVRRPCAYQASH